MAKCTLNGSQCDSIDIIKIKKKPFLCINEEKLYYCSISHKYGNIAVAINKEAEIGIDIEKYKVTSTGFQESIFNSKDCIISSHILKTSMLFCFKEAVYKAAYGTNVWIQDVIIQELKHNYLMGICQGISYVGYYDIINNYVVCIFQRKE